jgi:hypothetical protein
MKKTLAYILFKVGRIPMALMKELQSEVIEVYDEGIHCSLTFKNFKAPGRRETWRRIWFGGAIALTASRLVALSGTRFTTGIALSDDGGRLINVPSDDDRFRLMSVSLDKPDRLVIAFDASLFHHDWSGELEYRFRTQQAQHLLEAIKKHTF